MSVRRQLLKSLTYRKFIFACLVYLEGIPAKFVYEGHRVKVKVTGAKSRKSLTLIAHNSGPIKTEPLGLRV